MYCNWVQIEVDENTMPDTCRDHIADGKCMRCEMSPQLDYGMKPSELLRNIQV